MISKLRSGLPQFDWVRDSDELTFGYIGSNTHFVRVIRKHSKFEAGVNAYGAYVTRWMSEPCDDPCTAVRQVLATALLEAKQVLDTFTDWPSCVRWDEHYPLPWSDESTE